jgi:hypothetical protein
MRLPVVAGGDTIKEGKVKDRGVACENKGCPANAGGVCFGNRVRRRKCKSKRKVAGK